jgi:hypothetical protein
VAVASVLCAKSGSTTVAKISPTHSEVGGYEVLAFLEIALLAFIFLYSIYVIPPPREGGGIIVNKNHEHNGHAQP